MRDSEYRHSPTGHIAVLGDVVADITATISDEPPEWRSMTPPAEIAAGGTVGNTSMALARLGMDAMLMSAVGSDPFGRLVMNELDAAGIDTSRVDTVAGAFTFVVLAVSGGSIDRFFWGFPKDDTAASMREVSEADLEGVRTAAWLHVSGSSFEEAGLLELSKQSIDAARQAGVPISLDLNIRPKEGSLRDTYLEALVWAAERSDVVLGSSEDEITTIAGVDDPHLAAEKVSAGERVAIVRLGSDGAYVAPGGHLAGGRSSGLHVPAFAVDVVSAMGAGDVFDAGFITSMLHGDDLETATRWANATAAVACTGAQAYSEVSTAAVEGLLRRGGSLEAH